MMGREKIKITQILDHHLPTSENGVSLVGPCRPNIECWLGSFVIIQGIVLRGKGTVSAHESPLRTTQQNKDLTQIPHTTLEQQ